MADFRLRAQEWDLLVINLADQLRNTGRDYAEPLRERLRQIVLAGYEDPESE